MQSIFHYYKYNITAGAAYYIYLFMLLGSFSIWLSMDVVEAVSGALGPPAGVAAGGLGAAVALPPEVIARGVNPHHDIPFDPAMHGLCNLLIATLIGCICGELAVQSIRFLLRHYNSDNPTQEVGQEISVADTIAINSTPPGETSCPLKISEELETLVDPGTLVDLTSSLSFFNNLSTYFLIGLIAFYVCFLIYILVPKKPWKKI